MTRFPLWVWFCLLSGRCANPTWSSAAWDERKELYARAAASFHALQQRYLATGGLIPPGDIWALMDYQEDWAEHSRLLALLANFETNPMERAA